MEAVKDIKNQIKEPLSEQTKAVFDYLGSVEDAIKSINKDLVEFVHCTVDNDCSGAENA